MGEGGWRAERQRTCRVVHETGRVEADGVNPGVAEAGNLFFFPVPCLLGAPRSKFRELERQR